MLGGVKLDLVFIGLGILFLLGSPSYGLGTLATPGPAMVPAWLASILLVLAILDIAVSRGTGAGKAPASAKRPSFDLRGIWNDPTVSFMLVTGGALLLTGLIGLLPSIAVYGAVASWRIGWGPRWKNVALGLVLWLTLYCLFTVTFQIEFPVGRLLDLIGG